MTYKRCRDEDLKCGGTLETALLEEKAWLDILFNLGSLLQTNQSLIKAYYILPISILSHGRATCKLWGITIAFKCLL